ncbi:uncharacterized protein LOC142490723 [Ascaphus truei]|uniref:uncharacterized protein LOC142490723 n=1 Tax=Ascaphus truei TaxID=8439 RepID=UPI003F5A8008
MAQSSSVSTPLERLLFCPVDLRVMQLKPWESQEDVDSRIMNDIKLDPFVAPEGHVSPETEQVSSPGSASSTHLEEHDEEDFDDDDDDDDDDAAAAAIDTQIQASDHEEVPIETVLPPKRPANTTYDAIVASEGKIVEAENRRHSDLMTVLERMIALQEETISQLAHLHRVFIEVPKQLQKINTSFEALVVQQTQANYWRMTNVPQFNTSQPGSVHAGQFSPHSSDIHSPGPNVTGQVADIVVQVPDHILPLSSVQIQQQTPTKEATKTKQDTHETDQPSLVQCLPTCSHVSVGTSPVREQSLPKSPVGESLPKSIVGESLPKSPVGESLPKSPVGESLPKSPVGESLPKSPVGESLPKSPVGESLATSPVGESLATSPVGEQSLPKSPVGNKQVGLKEDPTVHVAGDQKQTAIGVEKLWNDPSAISKDEWCTFLEWEKHATQTVHASQPVTTSLYPLRVKETTQKPKEVYLTEELDFLSDPAMCTPTAPPPPPSLLPPAPALIALTPSTPIIVPPAPALTPSIPIIMPPVPALTPITSSIVPPAVQTLPQPPPQSELSKQLTQTPPNTPFVVRWLDF